MMKTSLSINEVWYVLKEYIKVVMDLLSIVTKMYTIRFQILQMVRSSMK